MWWLRLVVVAVALALAPLWLPFWLLGKAMAARCPKCKSKWHTEILSDNREGRHWFCYSCYYRWCVDRDNNLRGES